VIREDIREDTVSDFSWKLGKERAFILGDWGLGEDILTK
jgi:hypothetical protein